MKRDSHHHSYPDFTLLCCLLLLCLAPAASAQVVPNISSPADAIILREAERVQQQSVERVQRQVDSVQEQTSDRVQNQAAERIQQQADSVQQLSVERVQNRAGNTQQRVVELIQQRTAAASERAQLQVERLQGVSDELAERVPSVAELNAEQVAAAIESGDDSLLITARQPLPERLSIAGQDGSTAFVEVNLAPGVRVVEGEWVMVISAEERSRLDNEAPELMAFLSDSQSFTSRNAFLLTFMIPPDLDNETVLGLVPQDLRPQIERNHIYSAQVEDHSAAGGGAGSTHIMSSPLTLPMNAVCEEELAVGIVDSRVNPQHSAFAALHKRQGLIMQDMLDASLVSPDGHGTAVAGLLAGEGPELQPLLPRSRIYTAAVFYAQDEHHQGATVSHLLAALDWLLSQEDVRVINMSLTGPHNRLLASTLTQAREAGKLIVAAAGNEGPHGRLLYPAAYDGVLAVSAVDRDGQPYRWSNQGKHVDFAALGVSVPTARGDGSFGRESGTSLSAPVVSAFMACALAQYGSTEKALAAVRSQALDLGPAGRDQVYGYGLLHP